MISTKIKKAIVIGVSTGVGKEVARLLVKDGYKVAITGRHQDNLDELKAENTNLFYPKAFGISDTQHARTRLDELVTELGGLDLFAISAAIRLQDENLDFELGKNTIDINVSGFVAVINWVMMRFETRILDTL